MKLGIQRCRYSADPKKDWISVFDVGSGTVDISWFKLSGFMSMGTAVQDGGGGCLAWTGMIKQVCRGWTIAKSRTRVSEINSSS